MSDNIIQFAGKGTLKLAELGKTVLVIRPDGAKPRAPGMIPLDMLPKEELLKIIDELCEMVRERR